jgi:hypothetical protein
MTTTRSHEISWELLCWRCNTDDLDFETTDDLAPLQGFVGQDRALRSLAFGLEVEKPGYNLFVTGLTGTGRTTAIKTYVQAAIEQRSPKRAATIRDWCYVYNFGDPDRPFALSLPVGRGKRLQQSTEALLKAVKDQLQRSFESEEYQNQRSQVEEQGRLQYQTTVQSLERTLRQQGLGIQISPAVVNVFPLDPQGRPMPPDVYLQLPESTRASIESKRDEMFEVVNANIDRLHDIERDARDRLQALERSVADRVLARIFSESLQEWSDFHEVFAFLTSLKEHSLTNFRTFLSQTGISHSRWRYQPTVRLCCPFTSTCSSIIP